MAVDAELEARRPVPVNPDGFNANADLPYGCTTAHVRCAMEEFIAFLGFVSEQLNTRGIARLEAMLMPANFSSMVGEFMSAGIAKHCPSLVKNQYHNGHPDLIPRGRFPNDAVLHTTEGIEVKASRYPKGWQGHNPEDVWLMVFIFDASGPRDSIKGIAPRPFRFTRVVGARLTQEDWAFSGRSATSRRTITASVTPSGYEKMTTNWIYDGP